MARQTKKIAKKIQPKKVEPEDKNKKPARTGRDYLLIVVLSLTLVFLIFGWENFTMANRGLYLALLGSLTATYIRRNYTLSEVHDLWVERAGYASMFIAIILFAYVVYQQYFA
ncbi:MAG: hypothetical protein K6G55_03905 [Selenomonadaceae bacterium]|nr:hypothetical protein [Selenomonadaceae bacterium]